VRNAESSNSKPETRNPKLFRDEHGLDDKFVVMYSGNLGLAHPFEAILDAAERVQPALPHVVFLFVGGGPRLTWVQEQVQRRHLQNVRFLPFQPRERLAQSLAAADLHLASMRHELCGLVVPSKVYGVLAAGRPCVFLGPEESEAAQFILQHGCGSVLAHATGARLAATVSHWATHPDQLREAYRRVEAVADRAALPAAVEAFDRILGRVLDPNSPRRQSEARNDRPQLEFRAGSSRIS
jgi:glycosyltransferase involved in cell wall biosynthesis